MDKPYPDWYLFGLYGLDAVYQEQDGQIGTDYVDCVGGAGGIVSRPYLVHTFW